MNILELFSGTESFSNEARKRGHECFTIDKDMQFRCNLHMDLCTDADVDVLCRLGMNKPVDVLWASPPCTAFSPGSIGTHWGGGFRKYEPKTETAKIGILLLENTLRIITALRPKYFFIENPRGVMRKMKILEEWETKGKLRRDTVTYCQYGARQMKPTDIWHNCWQWKPRPKCKNGAPCHEAAPRGSRTGTQGLKNSKERGKVPEQLCNEILDAIERRRN